MYDSVLTQPTVKKKTYKLKTKSNNILVASDPRRLLIL
jgi:hypothetical protein